MNSLYTLALRQSASLSSDLKQLDSLSSPSPSPAPTPTPRPPPSSALHGQINASLAAFDRTIDDYDSMARREIVDAKREKALARVARFRDELAELRKEYDRVKLRARQAVRPPLPVCPSLSRDLAHVLDTRARARPQETASNRSELFASSSSSAAPSSSASASASASSFSSHAYASSTSRPSARHHPDVSIPMAGPSASSSAGGMGADYAASVHNNARTNHALREHDFVQQTGATLDAYLAQGQAVLGNLANQRDVMKGALLSLPSSRWSLGTVSTSRAHGRLTDRGP